ncbi:IS66 family transposase zinc-finger binding domain-containing protein [Microvirgula aerodenitrificans]|uniref:IS66 family transposase zinc-finger binding domain-containing protein n=1 Tax=Microvirgula aerodenitrificans TaxID=57480 RepID=UPI000A02F931
MVCPESGGDWHWIGEDSAKVLKYVPPSVRVVRHVRPHYACCGCITQTAAPPVRLPGALPIRACWRTADGQAWRSSTAVPAKPGPTGYGPMCGMTGQP